jgi:hypothetical protein
MAEVENNIFVRRLVGVCLNGREQSAWEVWDLPGNLVKAKI